MAFLNDSALARRITAGGLRRRATLIAMVCGFIVSFARPVDAQLTRADQLKAAFVCNFVQFVEWPADAFASPDAPIVIGIFGKDPFGRTIDELVADETVQNRKVVVRRFANNADITNVHVLYIGQSELPHLDKVLAATRGSPILTVTDIPTGSQRGCIIELFMAGDKMRFRINTSAVRRNRLELSSKLLRLADLVQNGSLQR